MITKGKLAKPVLIGLARELSPEDTPQLRAPRAVPKVRKFREAHHRLAMLMAQGHDGASIMKLTGYSSGRISSLGQDPAFQDLVAQKRALVEKDQLDADATYREEILRARMAAIRHVNQYIEETDELDETIPIRVALSLSEFTADRTGFGKHTTSTNQNVNWTVTLEERIRKFNRLKTVPEIGVKPLAVVPFKRRI
jgi:hypothetical protein